MLNSRTLVWSLLSSTVGLAAACASQARMAANVPYPCDESIPLVDGARVAASVDAPGFSLVVPAGFEPVAIQGIDSQVGQWADGAGGRITYDYGASISQDALRARLAGYSECRDTIGGFPVLIAAGHDTAGIMYSTARLPQYVAVATWRERPRGPHMSVGVTSRDVAGLRRGLGVIRTIRFP